MVLTYYGVIHVFSAVFTSHCYECVCNFPGGRQEYGGGSGGYGGGGYGGGGGGYGGM